MPMTLSIEEITGDFPLFKVAVVHATGLQIVPKRADDLNALIELRQEECRTRFPGTPLSEIAGISVWRDAYRRFGVKKTSYRNSVERIVKNILTERGLPEINSFVDCYNAVSLKHIFPVGADDLGKIENKIAFRYSRPADTFFPLGQSEAENDPPKSGEVVLAAGSNVLCRRWNWYQDARSPIGLSTDRALVTIQSHGEGDLKAAADDLVDLLGRFCNAGCHVKIASADNPLVELPDG